MKYSESFQCFFTIFKCAIFERGTDLNFGTFYRTYVGISLRGIWPEIFFIIRDFDVFPFQEPIAVFREMTVSKNIVKSEIKK